MMKRKILLSAIFLTYSAVSFAAATPVDNNNVVTVNGVSITAKEVTHFMSKLGKKVAPERALQEMINIELLVQAAKNQGIMKNEELALEIHRSTSGLIASHYLQQQLAQLKITEEDLKARYNKDYIESNSNTEYNANHILVKTEEEANDIIKQLDDGESFTDLAKQFSTGPSGVKGGALGWFKTTDMVAPFSNATKSLTPGSYSKQPVQTQFGWHIIKLNETRTSEPPAFESVSKKLGSAIAAEEISRIMLKLHETANIEFNKK